MNLHPELEQQLEGLLQTAEDHEGRGDLTTATHLYQQVLNMLPAEGQDSFLATRARAALGDIAFQQAALQVAWDHLQAALATTEGKHNAFVLLRLGQVALDLQQPLDATEYLSRAYWMGGPEVFQAEDPRYLDHIQGFLKGPAGGW